MTERVNVIHGVGIGRRTEKLWEKYHPPGISVDEYISLLPATLRKMVDEVSLNGHPKSGPPVDRAKPASDEFGQGLFLSCRWFLQVSFHTPTFGSAFEHVAMMEEPVQHGTHGHSIA